MIQRRRVAPLFVLALVLLVPSPAQAVFPGQNGPILFEAVRDGHPRGVYRMEADGSNVQRLTPTTGTRYADPSVSSDGRKVAVRGCPEPPATEICDIYVMNADGTGTPLNITNTPAVDEFDPAISPNGARVAYVFIESTPDGQEQDVWIKNANGTGSATNLTGGTVEPIGDPNNGNDTAFVNEFTPNFSPSGARIAFTSDRPILNPPDLDGDPELWVMDADGTDKQQLTEDHDPLTPIPFPPGDFSPNFSPDGTKIGWTRLTGPGNFDLVWRNSSGPGAPAPLVTQPASQEHMTFSPDGTKLAFLGPALPPLFRQDLFVADVNFSGGTTTATNITNHAAGQIGTNPDWAAIPPAPTPPRRTYPLPPVGVAAFAGCPALTATVILGTAASNSLVGTARGDRIFAGAGDDTADGLAGDDCIDLGAGTDRGQGGDGRDLILGGLGVDNLVGNLGNDRLLGGDGGDRLIGGFGDDTLGGQSGADRINGERGRDRITGGSSNDVISAGSSGDRASGGGGNDRVSGNSGNDSLSGNAGRDRMTGGSGRDRLSGGSGADRISARDGRRDRINCGGGRDRVTADRTDRVAGNCERVRRR